MSNAKESAKKLAKFCKPKETAMITFNFIGLGGEEAFVWGKGETIWEAMPVKCLNLLVDHPLYYHKYLEKKTSGHDRILSGSSACGVYKGVLSAE